MNQHLFYSAIRNQMASELLKHPNYIDEFDHTLNKEHEGETIFTFCNEAARIFYAIGDLSGQCCSCLQSNSVEVINEYTSAILEKLINDEKPLIIDLIVLAGETIRQFC